MRLMLIDADAVEEILAVYSHTPSMSISSGFSSGGKQAIEAIKELMAPIPCPRYEDKYDFMQDDNETGG